MGMLAPITYPSPDTNPFTVYLSSLSAGSRATITGSLRVVADMLIHGAEPEQFPWHHIRYQHSQAVRSRLMELYAPSTANKILTALRRVLHEAWRLGYMDSDAYYRASDIPSVTGTTLPQSETGRHIQYNELEALFAACNDGSPIGARDAAVIAVSYSAGLRRAEIAGLLLSSFNSQLCEISVVGKRRKARVVPVAEDACRAIVDWIAVRGSAAGPLFCRVLKNGRIVHDRLSASAIYRILNRRAIEAGLAHMTPHDLRRSFVSDLLDAGVDIATVQQMAGHSDPKTTASYDRRDSRAKQEAARKLNVPYRR